LRSSLSKKEEEDHELREASSAAVLLLDVVVPHHLEQYCPGILQVHDLNPLTYLGYFIDVFLLSICTVLILFYVLHRWPLEVMMTGGGRGR